MAHQPAIQSDLRKPILRALQDLKATNKKSSVGAFEIVTKIFGEKLNNVDYGLMLYSRVDDTLDALLEERSVDVISTGTYWRYQKWFLL